MSTSRVIAWAVLLSLLLVPMLNRATDDLSASGALSASAAGRHHQSALRHQPPTRWRPAPAAVERPAPPPRAVPLATIDLPRPGRSGPLLVRTLFVPPRG